MKHDISEEQLIQFALGELDGPARAAVERALAKDQALQEALGDIEATVRSTSTALASHPDELGEVRRRAIEQAAPTYPVTHSRTPRSRTRWTFVASAAAAAIAVMTGGNFWVLQQPTDEEVRLAGDRLEALQWANGGYRPDSRSSLPFLGPEAAGNPFRIGNKQALEQITVQTAELEENERRSPRFSGSAGDSVAPNDGATTGGPVGTGEHLLPRAAYDVMIEEREQRESQQQTTGAARIRAARQQVTPDKDSSYPAATERRSSLESLGYIDSSSQSTQIATNRVGTYVQGEVSTTQVSVGEEAYMNHSTSSFTRVVDAPLSTFSIDVDTASYSNVRRFLSQRQLPPPDAVRVEEMINYFSYDYPQPLGEAPFSASIDVAVCPWDSTRWLAQIGLQGREVPRMERQAANLVFLLDVSGSMQPANKLPLVQQAMRLLVKQLQANDRVVIVTYAGSSQVALESTTVGEAATIENAITQLTAGGSTNGAGGIQAAYRIAREQFVSGGINRVILATDGDFNVGITSREELLGLITSEARSGVFLTVLGFGMGNLKDATLELLADKGNGNYAYIDSFSEARKVFVEELTSNLVTIAKDVKIQVEFNPARIQSYRLIGYENRMLAAQDFNDDTKDAGEIGAGHAVTALYELVLVGAAGAQPGVDDLKYQSTPRPEPTEVSDTHSNELFTVKLRYKQPEGEVSSKLEFSFAERAMDFANAPTEYRFACAVAMFGMILRGDPAAASLKFNDVLEPAEDGLGNDPFGHRAEFVDLVRTAMELMPYRAK